VGKDLKCLGSLEDKTREKGGFLSWRKAIEKNVVRGKAFLSIWRRKEDLFHAQGMKNEISEGMGAEKERTLRSTKIPQKRRGTYIQRRQMS